MGNLYTKLRGCFELFFIMTDMDNLDTKLAIVLCTFIMVEEDTFFIYIK